MRDDDELKVRLGAARIDDLTESVREPLLIRAVEVGRRFVQSEDPAVDTKGVGEGEANDEGGEDLKE